MERRVVLKSQSYDPAAAAAALHGLDAITLEVVRMALYEISMDMAITMMRVSGSPIFTEVQDFSTGLLDSSADHLAFGGYLQLHMSNSLLALKHLLSKVSLEDMQPGDAWLCNDPFIGSSQANDFGVLTPAFVEGQVVGFAWSEGHVLDVGGMVAGGFAVGAEECFAEGLRFPNVKIAGPDGIDRDMVDFIKNNVRLPVSVENDLRALLAANRLGRLRMQALVKRYGVAEFQRHCEGFKTASERSLRARLGAIPDGEWEVRDWAEHNGRVNELYELEGTLEIRGDTLAIHFTGVPQTNGVVNGTFGCVLGNVLTALMQVLAPDIPFNSGILRPIGLTVDDGTVLSALPPAPVSIAHMEATTRAGKMTTELLSKAALTSEDASVRQLAMGQFHDAFPVMIWVGEDEFGYTVFANSDGGMGGGGAQSVTDGLDIAATMTQPGNSLVDVEVQEQLYPVIYLYRRLSVDSAGPGVYRGGLGGEAAMIPWHTADGFVGTLTTACNQVPPRGIAGGFPGGAAWFEMVRDVDVPSEFLACRTLPSFEALANRGELLEAKQTGVVWPPDRVFKYGVGGGGGFGDPLLRAPQAVAADVLDGYVTVGAAEGVYGVVFGPPGQVDEGATKLLRTKIRERRLGRVAERAVTASHEPGEAFDRIIEHVGASHTCRACGESWTGADWRDRAETSECDLREYVAAAASRVAPRDGMAVKMWLCPGCGTSLDVTISAAERAIAASAAAGARAAVAA